MKRYGVLLALLVVFSTVVFSTLPGMVSAGTLPRAYVEWKYRTAVTISNPNSYGLMDFQVKIVLDSSWPGWDNVREDGADIRFATAGGTVIPYWIEKWDYVGQNAVVWVKVPSIPAGGTTIYLYYGNPSAVSESDADAVFDFFDDFNAGTLDTTKWELVEDGCIFSDSYIGSKGDGTACEIRSMKVFTSINGYRVDVKVLAHSDYVRFKFGFDNNHYTYDDKGSDYWGFVIDGNWIHFGYDVPSGGLVGVVSLAVKDKTILFDNAHEEGYSVPEYSTSGGRVFLRLGWHTSWSHVDWVRVRKYADQEVTAMVSTVEEEISKPYMIELRDDIRVYENSICELTFTLIPTDDTATYNTYLSLSGLTNVLEVRKNGQLVSPESGKYYLGGISADTQVSIKFKATTVGTKAFSIILTSNDAIMSKTYTTSKQVTYEVIPLPFSIQLPDWTVGENSLRIAESSGQDMVLILSLKDPEGNEVWSDSYSFGPYESHEFTVSIPQEGVYSLEIQFSGTTAIFDINVNPPIQLFTDTIKVRKGDVGTVQLLVKNPSSLTKYYEVILTGGFIEGNITKAIAVAPSSEKTVEIAFQVPKDVQFDAYDLQIEVLEGNEVLFKGLIHVMIDNSGFSLPIGSGSGGSTLPLALGALILIGGVIYVLRRR